MRVLVLTADPNGRAVKAWICGRSFSGAVGLTSARGLDVLSLVDVSCQVEVSAKS
jgi:hypothetical protein